MCMVFLSLKVSQHSVCIIVSSKTGLTARLPRVEAVGCTEERCDAHHMMLNTNAPTFPP